MLPFQRKRPWRGCRLKTLRRSSVGKDYRRQCLPGQRLNGGVE
jgi:hypothetical protein